MILNNQERPKVGVGVAVLAEGMVLLGKRKGTHGSGLFAMPGGHLEYGETVEECAKRELFEETGLEATALELGTWTNDLLDGAKHFVTLFVFVHAFTGELALKEPNKCEGWDWYHWHRLPMPLFQPILSMIDKVGMDQFISAKAKR